MPRSIAIDEPRMLRTQRNDQIGVSRTDIKLHWFRLNEPLDDEWFSGEAIEDREQIMKWVDPVRTGANSLVDGSRDKDEGDSKNRAREDGVKRD